MAAVDGGTDDGVMARLSTLSLDNNAKRAIVKGVDTVSKNDMPFVNRHEELWQLFRVNAEVCDRIAMSTEESISDFRDLDLLFCVQYFGAGKTTLGKLFPGKVKDDDAVKHFICTKLEDADDGLKAEWEKISHGRGIQRVLIDVRAEPNIILEAAILASGDTNVDIRGSPKVAAQHLIQYATDHGPTLFHFDEVCSDEEHNLDKLRKLVCAAWAQMHAICRDCGSDAMPRIYFLVTGKSIEPFADVGSGSSGMGSYFLVLDMLNAEHVGAVRSHLMNERKDQNGKRLHALQLENLNEMEHGGYLNDCLSRATGGAPRLLLYALRALELTKASLASTDKIDAAVMETVFSLLHGIRGISSEFLPTSSSLQAFQLLLGFSLQRTKLELSTEVKLHGKDTKLSQILRFQPFFLSRDDCSDGQFVLHLPLYHLQAAKKKFGSDAASMLLISMAGGTISANEAWRVFELLPAQVMASKAAVSQQLKSTTALSWSEALPGLLGDSELAKTAKFDLGSQPFIVHREKRECPAVIENHAEQFVERGGSVLPPDKSQSADLFHVQRRIDGNGHVLIEWQSKFKVGSQLNMSIVRDEVGKAAKKLDTVHIIYSATVGKQLIGAMPNGDYQVLTLRSWDSETAAVFAFATKASPTLLWRSSTADQWYEFPDQVAVSDVVANEDATVVEVRPGLEVVIPHHDAVKQLVGPSLFDSLKSLSEGENNSSAVGSVVTTLGEVLGSASSQQQQPEQKHDDDEIESKLKEAKAELDKAEAKLDKAEAKLEKAEASGDQDNIARAKEGAATAQDGVTAAQSLVTYWAKKITGH